MLDVEEIPHNNSSWQESARSAILNPNCYCVLFFRSEKSAISGPCLNELVTATYRKNNALSPTSIDIWMEDKDNASMKVNLRKISGDSYYNTDTIEICQEIAELSGKNANAIRLHQDCGDDEGRLISKISEVLKTEFKTTISISISITNTNTFKYDWNTGLSSKYDYFFGAYDTYDPETTEFLGYSPAFVIKKCKTNRVENYIVYVNDVCDVDNVEGYCDEAVTVAYICDDGSKPEDFIIEFEADPENKKYYDMGCGFLIHYMEEKMSGHFYRIAVKAEDQKVDFCDKHKMFLKYFMDDQKDEIEDMMKLASRYRIACDDDGYVYWNK